MEGCNWRMRSVIVLVITNLLPLAMTLYEDLGYLCVQEVQDEEYKAVQTIISYNATPYPFVTNGTNITLTCAGRSVDFVNLPEDQSYMKAVEFYKNNQLLRKCIEDPYLRFRNLSCSATVTGVVNNDKFMCIIRASFAPCNAAQIRFQVGNPVAPHVSRLFPTLKYDDRKLEMTCTGTGIPEPNVAWLLNGSLIDDTSTEKAINAVVDTKLADVQNGTNSYLVNSKIVITDRKFPLHIQCVVKNEMDKMYSENVYTLYVAIINVKLTTATVHWLGHPDMNTNFLSGFVYNVSLKCGKEYNETMRIYNRSSVTFNNLTMGRRYTVKIQALNKMGDLAIGAPSFYLPDVIPAPKNVKMTSISANFAIVQWSVIERQEEKYDRVTGYIVTVINETYFFTIKVSNSSSSVSINHLLSNTSYRVSVVGLSEETEGMPSEWISFKTSLTQDRLGQFPCNDQGKSNETKEESSLSLAIVILLIAIILIAIIASAAFAFFQLRRRKSQDISPNQVVMDNPKKYHNDGASNDAEGSVKVIRYGHFSW